MAATDTDVIEIVVRMHANRPIGPLVATLRAMAAIEEVPFKASFEQGQQVYTLLRPEPQPDSASVWRREPLPAHVADLGARRKLRQAELISQIFPAAGEPR